MPLEFQKVHVSTHWWLVFVGGYHLFVVQRNNHNFGDPLKNDTRPLFDVMFLPPKTV